MPGHVHIVGESNGFNLRVGLFRSFVGWQTAEVAQLPVQTRDSSGREIARCLDGLSQPVAKDLAAKLDEYLERQGFGKTSKSGPSAKERKLDPVKLKYEEAMKSK